jgi:NitT/TauT family transport system permease protein
MAGIERAIAHVAKAKPRPRIPLPLGSRGFKVLGVLVLLAIWHVVSAFYPPAFLPGPSVTLERLAGLVATGEFARHAGPTLLRVFLGFGLALLVGTAVGIAMGARKTLESFFEPYILVGLTVPGLAWAILALMWFGVSEVAPMFAISAVVTPMLAVNMWQGTQAIDRELLEMAHAFRISRLMVVREIVLPQLLPFLLAGSRFGLSLGWKVVVLSEMFGLTSGIGYMINRSFSLYSMRDVLAWTIGFTFLMGIFEYGLLRPVERALLRWRPAISF